MDQAGLERLMPKASAAERDAVASRLVRRTLAANEVVIHATDESSTLCLVESGRLSVSIERDGQTIALPCVEPNDWVGEVDLLDPGPAATTLTADGATVLWTIDAAGVASLMDDNPVAASALLFGLTSRLATRLRTARLPSLEVDESGALHAMNPTPVEAPSGWVARLFGGLFGGQAS